MLARMREMSVTEQRYQAVLDVIGQGRAVMEVASPVGGEPTHGRALVGSLRGPRTGGLTRPLPSAGAVSTCC